MSLGFRLLCVDWTAQALTTEQLLVLRSLAAKHLRDGVKNPVINFSHELCEGHITRGKVGVYGSVGGTFFKADLGTVKGEPWTITFFIPRHSEQVIDVDIKAVVRTRPLSTADMQCDRAGDNAGPTIH